MTTTATDSEDSPTTENENENESESESEGEGASVTTHQLLTAMREIDPYDFEHLVADVWEVFGWDTSVTTASNDEGVDVIATQNDLYESTTYIQAKCYGENTTIGSDAIQQYASLRDQDDGVDLVVVVTTGRFSSSAEDMAQRLNVKTVDGIELAEFMTQLGITHLVADYSDDVAFTPDDEESDETYPTMRANVTTEVTDGDGRGWWEHTVDNVRDALTAPYTHSRRWTYYLAAWGGISLLSIGLSAVIPPLAIPATAVFTATWVLLPIAMAADIHTSDASRLWWVVWLASTLPAIGVMAGAMYLHYTDPVTRTRMGS